MCVTRCLKLACLVVLAWTAVGYGGPTLDMLEWDVWRLRRGGRLDAAQAASSIPLLVALFAAAVYTLSFMAEQWAGAEADRPDADGVR